MSESLTIKELVVGRSVAWSGQTGRRLVYFLVKPDVGPTKSPLTSARIPLVIEPREGGPRHEVEAVGIIGDPLAWLYAEIMLSPWDYRVTSPDSHGNG